jgi:hypothetical protein
MVGYSRIETVELKETVIVRFDALVIGERRAFKNDGSAGTVPPSTSITVPMMVPVCGLVRRPAGQRLHR